MQLYILSKDPIRSASLIPDKYKFKMLIELGQLTCSAGISNQYKKIAQGKELQSWVSENKEYTYVYYDTLYRWSVDNICMKDETLIKILRIREDLKRQVGYNYNEPTHAYLRYAKEYKCNVASKTLLQIDNCIEEYQKYLNWKMTGGY